MRSYTHFDGSSGAPIVRLSQEAADDCSAPGQDASESCAYWLSRVEWLATADTLRSHLREYGAWDDLDTADEDTLRSRALWVAACDCREEPDLFAEDAA